MADPYTLRQQQKRPLEAYRTAARRLVGTHARVPLHANVQPCEDGAYVEAVVWVPQSELLKPEEPA